MAELSMRRTGVYAARGDFGFGDFQTPTGSMLPVGSGSTLGSLLSAGSSILKMFTNTGAQQMPSNPNYSPGIFGTPTTTGLGGIINRVFLGSPNAGAVAAPGDLFSTGGATTVRPMRKVPVTGPDGRLYWFGYLGRPILFSGDLAASRRVSRVARRAVRVSHRRRFRR